jgi:hypothetical protein
MVGTKFELALKLYWYKRILVQRNIYYSEAISIIKVLLQMICQYQRTIGIRRLLVLTNSARERLVQTKDWPKNVGGGNHGGIARFLHQAGRQRMSVILHCERNILEKIVTA